MFDAIIKFFKALFTVFVGLLILAAIVVAVSIILKLCGVHVAFLHNISIWVLSMLSRGIVWLYNMV